MKNLKWLSVLLLTTFLIYGCYEVNEEIVIDESGAGTFSSKMDMGALLEMMKSFGGEEMNKEGLDRIIDSTVMMASVIDSAKDLSPAQKALFSTGKMRIQMNLNESILKINTDFKFKSYDDLQMLLSGGGNMSAIGNLMKKVMDNKEEKAEAQPDSPKDPDLDKVGTSFNVVVKNGSITKSFDKEKYDKVMAGDEMAQMKSLGGAGMEVLYTTVIKLPRPATSPESAIVKFSPDKKTVTIRYNYLDIFEAPEKLTYSITY
jgi:hypothetical protein